MNKTPKPPEGYEIVTDPNYRTVPLVDKVTYKTVHLAADAWNKERGMR